MLNKKLKKLKKYIIGVFVLALVFVAFGLWQMERGNTPQAQAEPILEKTWNADTLVYPDGTNVSTFHAKWINYLSADKGWQSIDTKFVETPDGFKMSDAPFSVTAPLRSTGEAIFHNNNRWDVFKKKNIEEPSLDMSITALDVEDVPGRIETGDLILPGGLQKNVNYVVYDNAYLEGDLIYYVHFGTAPRLEKLVRINKKPTQYEYSFKVKYSDNVEFNAYEGSSQEWTDIKDMNIKGKGLRVKMKGSDTRGISFKPFRIWDSNLEQSELGQSERIIDFIAVHFRSDAPSAYILTKQTKEYFTKHKNLVYPIFTDTTSTFYSDANPESTTVDGRLYYSNPGYPDTGTTWSNARTATSDIYAGDAGPGDAHLGARFIRAGSESSDTPGNPAWAIMERGIVLFDTSSIPDSNILTSVTISLWCLSSDRNFTASIVASTPASNTGLTASDYNQLGSSSFGNTATSDCGVYRNVTLDSNGLAAVSKTGVTKLGTRAVDDINNSEPNGSAFRERFGSTYEVADQTGTSNDPYLTVVHRRHRSIVGQGLDLERLKNLFVARLEKPQVL